MRLHPMFCVFLLAVGFAGCTSPDSPHEPVRTWEAENANTLPDLQCPPAPDSRSDAPNTTIAAASDAFQQGQQACFTVTFYSGNESVILELGEDSWFQGEPKVTMQYWTVRLADGLREEAGGVHVPLKNLNATLSEDNETLTIPAGESYATERPWGSYREAGRYRFWAGIVGGPSPAWVEFELLQVDP